MKRKNKLVDGNVVKIHHPIYDYIAEEDKFKRTNSNKRTLQMISALMRNNSYVLPEVEENLITYMIENNNADYPKIMEKFPNMSKRYISNMRQKHSLPSIKKKKPLTFQRILELNNKRFCRKCGEEKDLSEWYSHTKSACIQCELNRGNAKNDSRMLLHIKSVDSFLSYKLDQCKKRKNLNGDNTLTFTELKSQYDKQNGKCFYSGRPLEIAIKNINSLSIDRIDSMKNYTKDNIILCCSICNFMKGSSTDIDFIKMCHDIAIKHPLANQEDSPT